MSRLRKYVIGVLAAATIAGASLAAPPAASAMPMSCAERIALSYTYSAWGHWWASLVLAANWYGKAEGIATGCY